jgi:hypothetical protein
VDAAAVALAVSVDKALALLDRTKEVDIETRGRDGTRHRVPIWILVIDGEAYVASYRGKSGRWWRELVTDREATLVAGRTRIDVRPHRVRSARIRGAMSAAFARKYRGSRSSVLAMQRPEVLETALRLELV